MLLKAQPGSDEFVNEKYAAQINAVLRSWSAGLLQDPPDLVPMAATLASNFSGASLRLADSKLLRSGLIEVHKNDFKADELLQPDAFLNDFRAALNGFTELFTAEFQITQIHFTTDKILRTRVRYELVGSGKSFYREQRVGNWDLEWEQHAANQFRLRTWRPIEETQSRSSSPIYADISEAVLGANPSYSAQLLHGSDYWRTVLDGASGIDIYGHNGVSLGDIDNDGYDDLYVCQPAGLPNRLYRNRGDGTYEDVTDSAGVGVLENTACALFADIDNDGRQDLLVVRTSGPILFVNQGNGKFRQKKDAFQFATPPQGTFTGAAIADYDRDGWLDIYFCLYIYYQGTDQYKYPLPYYAAENGPPNFLMRNNRDGTFRDVTAESGMNQNNTRYSFCCAWNDYNHDGWPDLYVVNDFGRKNLYRNNGNGSFTDVAAETGVEDVGAGMSVCWFDYNNDGAQDLYVADMWTAAGERISTDPLFQETASPEVRALYHKHAMGNSLFRADRTFQDVTQSAGVGLGRWSWSSDSWDFDHDGFPDLYVSNGMVSGLSQDDLNSFFWRQVVANSPAEPHPAHDYDQAWTVINELLRADGTWSGYERNVFYANNHDGTFSDISGAVGLDFLQDGRSFALADIDHDGRLEIILKNRNAPQVRVLRNVADNLPPSIAFRLKGDKSNRDAIGAIVKVKTNAATQVRSLQAGSGFLSQHSKEIFFGLGNAQGAIQATIRWPSGLEQQLHDLPPNHRVWVEEGSEKFRAEPFASPSTGREARATKTAKTANPHQPETLPTTAETWLLAPIAAPDFLLPDLAGKKWQLSSLHSKSLLLSFWSAEAPSFEKDLQALQQIRNPNIQILAINIDTPAELARLQAIAKKQNLSFPILCGSEDVCAIYNILFRYLFDRHRDLVIPTSFLIDASGEIVKLYQGTLDPEHLAHDPQNLPRTDNDRIAKALPFPGVSEDAEFQRNYLSYGSIYYQRGYYDQAGASFQRALRDDPSSAEAQYGLGSVYLEQQRNSEARDCFQRAVESHASYPDTLPNAWNNLGLLATREGRTAEAVPYFREALRLSPDHLVSLENLGNAYRQLKDWDEARATLERAVAVGPQEPEANYSLAMVYAQLNDTDRAYDYLQRALKLRPAYPEALNNLGVLYLRTGRRDQAVASFEECIRVAPAFDQSYLNLARVYVLENAPDKARSVLERLLQQHPDDPQAKQMLAALGQ